MTKTVTISALRSDLTPYAHHDVIVTLIAGSAGGVVGSGVVVESTTVPLDANGAGSVVLETNDVITPSGTFYRFTVVGSSPTITRSIALTTATASTVAWSLAGIQVGDPTEPQRDVSSTFVTVPDGTMPVVEAGYPPATQSLTNYLAAIDEALDGEAGLSDATPQALGTAGSGDGTSAARDDHVHAMPSASDVGADPAGTAASAISALDLGTAAQADTTDFATAAHTHTGVYEAAGVAAALVDDLSGVTDTATARTNLGLGGAAVLAVGTTAGTVAAGDDARLSDARTPTAHNHAASEVTSGTLDIARIPTGTTSTTVPLGNDSRFTDARTPTAHNHAASEVTSGTLDIARIPTGTTSTTVPLGNDSRFTDARTPTAHKSSHAPGGSDVLGVGHFAPDLPGVLGLGRRVGANNPVTRGMCMWIPMPLLAVPAKATTIWVKTATGVASCAMTGAICAAKSASLDAPGTILGSTSVGAMSLASSSAVVGGTLTSPVTLAAGLRYFVQIIALGGASNPTCQGADGLTEGNNWQNGSAGPVTPTAGTDTSGMFVWSGRSALEDNPARASYVTSETKPFVYVSLEAP